MSALILIGSLCGIYIAFKSVIALVIAELNPIAWEQIFVIAMFIVIIYTYLNETGTNIYITFIELIAGNR